MTIIDAAVILFGLFAGYWVVSKLFFATPKPEEEPRSAPGAQSPPATPAWYEILQLSPSAKAEEIRAAYKQLISQYHPDKVDQLGQELKDLANRKSQEINAAYRAGMAARGVAP